MPKDDSTKLQFMKLMQQTLTAKLADRPSLLWDLQYFVQLSWDTVNSAGDDLNANQQKRLKRFEEMVGKMVSRQPEEFDVTEQYLSEVFVQSVKRMLPYNFENKGRLAEFGSSDKPPGELKALEAVVVSLTRLHLKHFCKTLFCQTATWTCVSADYLSTACSQVSVHKS